MQIFYSRESLIAYAGLIIAGAIILLLNIWWKRMMNDTINQETDEVIGRDRFENPLDHLKDSTGRKEDDHETY